MSQFIWQSIHIHSYKKNTNANRLTVLFNSDRPKMRTSLAVPKCGLVSFKLILNFEIPSRLSFWSSNDVTNQVQNLRWYETLINLTLAHSSILDTIPCLSNIPIKFGLKVTIAYSQCLCIQQFAFSAEDTVPYLFSMVSENVQNTTFE